MFYFLIIQAVACLAVLGLTSASVIPLGHAVLASPHHSHDDGHDYYVCI